MTGILSNLLTPLMAYILLIARVWYGVNMIMHGYPKVLHRSQTIQFMAGWWNMQNSIRTVSAMVSVATLLEVAGALFMIAGFLVPIISAFYVIYFLGIIIMKKARVKSKYIDPSPNNYEVDALYLLIALIFVFTGAGEFSIDYLIGL